MTDISVGSEQQDRTDPGIDAPSRGRTKADQVAAEIERAIMAKEYVPDEIIGSEVMLAEQYSVSRPVIREAIRILEMSGVATVRRGPGGGLAVTEPNADPVVAAAQLFLSYRRVRPAQVHRARLALELACVEELIISLNEKKIAVLQQYIEEEAVLEPAFSPIGEHHGERFHLLIAELAGNTVLELFVPVLTRLSSKSAQFPRDEWIPRSNEIHRAHSAITMAVCQGDLGLAQHRLRSHLAAIALSSGEGSDLLA